MVDPIAEIHLHHVPFSKPARNALTKKILEWLTRLNDVDTRESSLRALHNIVRSMDPKDVHVFLQALYPMTDNQKPLCRQAYAELFGTLARIHPKGMQPHLTKVINQLGKRIADKDSRVRVAVARSFQEIVLCCIDNSSDVTIHHVFKVLFRKLAKSELYIQIGAAKALRSVISSSGRLIASALPRLCPRLLKALIDRKLKAQPDLLRCAGTLIIVGSTDIVK